MHYLKHLAEIDRYNTRAAYTIRFPFNAQNASHVLAMAWAPVCLSVRLSVYHTLALYQNGDTWNHEIFTVAALRSVVL